MKDQLMFGETYYGRGAMRTSKWEEFKKEVKGGNTMKPKEFIYFRLIDFGMRSGLSREMGDELLNLLHDFRDMDYKGLIATSWKSIIGYQKKIMSSETYLSHTVDYPTEWKMNQWRSGRPPGKIKITTRDPIQEIAMKLMHPEVIYGWGKHINYKAFESYELAADESRSRTYGCIMSSVWANKTEEKLLKRSAEGTLLPIILNGDGVALGSTNQQIETVLGTCGLFDDTLMEQPISTFCLNYMPKLPYSKEEFIDHLNKQAGFNKTKAKLAYEYFERKLERLFWSLVVKPICDANKNG